MKNKADRHKRQIKFFTETVTVLLVFMFFLLGGVSFAADEAEQTGTKFISNGGYLVQSETKTVSFRESELFVPGSTLKIATSLMALDVLGPNYRYETHFYLDATNNLYIKGFGDPFLTSEEILKISSELKDLGVDQVSVIFLDSSSFSLEKSTPGSLHSSNPYDAPNGALAVNFNSIGVSRKKDGSLYSAEGQTPDLPILQKLRPFMTRDRDRLNIGLLAGKTNIDPQLEYAGQLFAAQLKIAGIPVQGKIAVKKVPTDLTPILVHHNSKTLHQILRACLHYSNNFIANQVLLSCSLTMHGGQTTWQSARKDFTEYLHNKFGFKDSEVRVEDGAGLSRKNRMSAKAMVAILKKFEKYKSMLNPKKSALLKSGTLEGVYCYAGYFANGTATIPFAILLNQPQNARDQILHELHKAILQNNYPALAN